MKNVLLTTTALVVFAGAAAADVSFSGSADAGYNDDIEGGLFYNISPQVTASVDLGDGYSASGTLGGDLTTGGVVSVDAYPTLEFIGPYGSIKGGDLDDKGASEYFYADRDGMALDVENHDASDRFDIRALVELGDFGVAVGGDNDGLGGIDGLSVGAGATFDNITIGVGYDEADAGVAGDSLLATTAVSLDTTFGGATIGLSYADDTVETSIGVAVGYDVSADLSVAAYYASNTVADDKYGVSADYTMGALGLGVYYDSGNGATVDTMGLDVSYAVAADLTGYAGVYDNGTTNVFYVGAVYAINDNLSATLSYADADEISGPEFKSGTTIMLSASF